MLENEKRRFCVRPIDISKVVERFGDDKCDLYLKDGRVLTVWLNLYVAEKGGLSTLKMRTSVFLEKGNRNAWRQIPMAE